MSDSGQEFHIQEIDIEGRLAFANITDDTRADLRAMWPVIEANLGSVLRDNEMA